MRSTSYFMMAAGTATFFLAHVASAQCVTGGPGGAFPAAGSATGVWDSSLPTGQLVSPLAVVVPGGATVINSVKLNGLNHTWSGDVHVVLQSPGGTNYNILVRSDATSSTGGGCGDAFAGNYEIFDPITGNGCAGNQPMACPGSAIASGPYIQDFSTWTSGNGGLFNTPLESIPIASGTWTLSIYDWYPAGDNGTLTDWELCFGQPSTPPPPVGGPATVCVTGGGGGTFPVGGVNGTWPTTMPTGELIAPLAVTVPAGSTKIMAVTINGMSHSWSGDSQIVLEAPGGQRYNIFQDNNGVFAGGCGDDFAGDYTFVDGTLGVGNCGPASTFTCGFGVVAPDTYLQHYGTWPSGSSGITNTDLESIPISSGTWNLVFFDWYVAADAGTITSWDLCFDTAQATTYCTAKLNSQNCLPAIAASGTMSATATSGFILSASNELNNKVGLVLYSEFGREAAPFGPGGTLCVKAPTRRSKGFNSGGTPPPSADCTGVFAIDFNTFGRGLLGAPPNPAAYLSLPGQVVTAQFWGRDPGIAVPNNFSLSNGIEFTVGP